ncbi:MAG: HAD family phosphatase [Promethearchaeota archaeon]|nr:MAG: HAD family phosphatase [Candidatus Lokiarchaeota archaeon]
MIKNIIFDLGNVLLDFKPEKFLLKYSKDENYIGDFIFKVIKSKIWLNLDRGIISLERAKDKFIQKFPEERDFLVTFFEHWMEMLTPIEENVKILYDLKSNGYSIYILSNFIEEAFHFVKNQYKFLSLFDGKIISGKVRVIKPEINIYQRLIDKYNLLPDECVFIDDIQSFLTPAKKLNMKTILFLPNTDLRSELRDFGVNI